MTRESPNAYTVQRFPSAANEVKRICSDGIDVVEKTYAEVLTGYPDVVWPLSRMTVEAAVMQLLRDDLPGDVSVPVRRASEGRTLRMDHVPGRRLSEVTDAVLYDRSLWERIFRAYASLRDPARLMKAKAVLGDVLSAQKSILKCMLAWKTDLDPSEWMPDDRHDADRPAALPWRKIQFCAGDASGNNILLCGARDDMQRCAETGASMDDRVRGICLLDFECAHIGWQGWDVGQLLAVTEAERPEKLMREIVFPAFEAAVPDPDCRAACLFWRDHFQNYYLKTRKRHEDR